MRTQTPDIWGIASSVQLSGPLQERLEHSADIQGEHSSIKQQFGHLEEVVCSKQQVGQFEEVVRGQLTELINLLRSTGLAGADVTKEPQVGAAK